MTYKVVITREDGAWLADVPDVPGAHTYARTITRLLANVHEVIVLMDDLPDDAAVETNVEYQVDDLIDTAQRLGEERAALAGREAALKHETLAAIRLLTDNGYAVRDAAELLRITPGRVSQIAQTKDRETESV